MLSNILKSSLAKSRPLSVRAFATSKPFNYQILQLEDVHQSLREGAEKFA